MWTNSCLDTCSIPVLCPRSVSWPWTPALNLCKLILSNFLNKPLQVNLPCNWYIFLNKPPVPSTRKILSVSSFSNGSLAVPTMQSSVSLTKMMALQEQGSLCLMLAQCAAQETALEIVAVMSPMLFLAIKKQHWRHYNNYLQWAAQETTL